jgi:hypothetical protein
MQKYKDEYSKLFPIIIKSSKSDEHIFCTIFSFDVLRGHGRQSIVKHHVATIKHVTLASLVLISSL